MRSKEGGGERVALDRPPSIPPGPSYMQRLWYVDAFMYDRVTLNVV
jgi:hypothetical protein